MNCDWVRENITLYLYGELADDARHEAEQHIARCQACAAELAEQQEFQAQMNALPVEEPSASFLAASRMRLQEALEQVQSASRVVSAVRVRSHGMAAAGEVLARAGDGDLHGRLRRRAGGDVPVHAPRPVYPARRESSGASISGITSIEKDPATNNVKVQYDRVMPESVQGTVNDPKVQDMLLYAARSNENSGVRLNSVDALADKTDDPRVRETLTYALRYDSNPGVRLHALDGLGAYVKDDIRVRNAVLEALLNDSNLGVRSGALHSLEPVKTDSSVRMALQQLAKEDPSDYIRAESKRVLASMPTVY